ncbi:MAG: indolepyruvate oxidoreductase subunit beta [Peptostreptococcaceae bacterium]|nr:indolepyruvate oxidoreductase subunit beta [Peptostreptococcaceae bacterium]
MTKSVLLVGVGGQGTILVSKLLTAGLVKAGFDVKMSEIHGMSQRGGSVSTHVRYGEKVYSPVIEEGEADLLISFEKMEAIRWLKFLKPEGHLIVNNYKINPLPVLIGKEIYPEKEIDEELKLLSATVINAFDKASEIGNIRVMNVILLGTVVKMMNLEDIDWEEIIRNNVKEKFIDVNIKAFNEGIKLIDKREGDIYAL